jgi:hypothetical protein
MQAAQATPATPEPAATAKDTQATLAACDARLAGYRATLDAGGDPQTIAEWTRQVKAERAAALARDATPAEKAAIYDQLDRKVTFKPGEAKIRAEVTIGPESYVKHAEQCEDTGPVRGDLNRSPMSWPRPRIPG